jgi:hypothetical protein
MTEAIAMEALVVVVDGSRALSACRRTPLGAGTTTHMRLRVEDMAAAHLHHNAGRKVAVWVCQADRACVEHVLIAIQHGVTELYLGRH